MMSFGVPAGAITPTQLSPLMPGKPASAMVGISGMAAVRFSLFTASTRSLSSLKWGMTAAGELNVTGVCPPTTEAAAGPPPLNGTGTMSSPSFSRNCSPARCDCVPVPACA